MNTTGSAPELTISDDLLNRYAKLIYEVAGIRISPQKKALLSNRLRRRLRETNLPSFEAYLLHLSKLSDDDPEWDSFLQEITTHETYLFRDEVHWTWFQHTYLPQIVAEARAGKRQRSLRVWSAACSTGDEAFTIASCIAEHLEATPKWDVKIIGTDIGVDAVAQAKLGVFGSRSMRLVPVAMKTKHFTKVNGEGETFKAKPNLSQLTEFKQHNLMTPFSKRLFDVVFVKNVLIYFDDQSKRTVMEHIRQSLKPNGLLVAGAAECVSDHVKDFKRIQPWLFQLGGEK